MVGVFERNAQGESASEAGDFEFGVGFVQGGLQEDGGGFTFHGRVGGDDEFFDLVGLDTDDEFFDVQFVGRDAVHG